MSNSGIGSVSAHPCRDLVMSSLGVISRERAKPAGGQRKEVTRDEPAADLSVEKRKSGRKPTLGGGHGSSSVRTADTSQFIVNVSNVKKTR